MWKISSLKQLADQVMQFIGGVVEGPIYMGDFRFVVKTRYSGMTLEVYVSKSFLWVWVRNFTTRERFVCSFNSVCPGGLDHPVDGVFEKTGIRTFTNPALPKENITAVQRFCSDPENEQSVADLRLEGDETLALFADGMHLNLRCDVTLMTQRLGALHCIFVKNSEQLKVVYQHSFRIAIEDPHSATLEKALQHCYGSSGMEVPNCLNCKRPFHLLLTIDMQDPMISQECNNAGHLYIVTCLNCDSNHAPIYFDYSEDTLRLMHQEVGQSLFQYPDLFEMRDVSLIPESSLDEEAAVGKPGHRIGGYPNWIQGQDIPMCPKCHESMSYIAQLDSDTRVGIQFGDNGMLYTFICSGCRVVASFAQSH